jgi:hypothetical protein
MKRLALILAVLYTCAAFGLTLGFTKAEDGWALGRPFTVQGYKSGATYVIADGDNSAKFIMTDAGDVWNVGFGALMLSNATAPVLKTTKTGTATNAIAWPDSVLHLTTANMDDGFGSGIAFLATDSGVTGAVLGGIGAVRDGVDTEGKLVFYAGTAGAEPLGSIDHAGTFDLTGVSGEVTALNIWDTGPGTALRIGTSSSWLNRTVVGKNQIQFERSDINSPAHLNCLIEVPMGTTEELYFWFGSQGAPTYYWFPTYAQLSAGVNIGTTGSGADDNELCAGIADAGAYSLQGVTGYLSGDLTVQGGDLIGTTGTLNLFNGLSTTVNAFGAATVLNEGSSTCVHTLGGSLANNGTLRSGSVLTGTATGAKAQYSKTETNTVHESGDPVTVRVTVNNAGDVTWSWGYRNTAGSVVVITGAFSATFTTVYTCPESLKSFWFYPDNASDPNTNVVMTINTGYLNVVGAATIAGRLVTTPSADTAITAAGGITAMNRFMIVHGSGGAIDITANPQIADGIHGQELYVIGYHEANTVKLETGTGCLGAGGTLGAGDVLHYMYDAALDVWIQLGPLQNN